MPKMKSQEALVRKRKRWVVLAILVIIIAGCYQWWRQGTLRYEEWSPNQQYVVRNYKVFEFIPRIAMPGDGGHYSGFMRVYDRHGKLLYEEYSSLLDFVEGPFWTKEGVYWMGNNNQDIVPLPTSPLG